MLVVSKAKLTKVPYCVIGRVMVATICVPELLAAFISMWTEYDFTCVHVLAL